MYFSSFGQGALAAAVKLPARLAQLRHLEELELVQYFAPVEGGVPPEWLAPGAFPHLRRCVCLLRVEKCQPAARLALWLHA